MDYSADNELSRSQSQGPSRTQEPDQDESDCLSPSQRSGISHWVNQGNTWPKGYAQDNDPQNIDQPQAPMPFLLGKQRDQNPTPSDIASLENARYERSAAYRNSGYSMILQLQGGLHMNESAGGISEASKTLCRNLLENKYAIPENTIFADASFDEAMRNLHAKNEAKIIQDISRLLVPSAETVATMGDDRLEILVESVNERWGNCLPVTDSYPQPDYAVGFRRTAFSQPQLAKLGTSLTSINYQSHFMGTFYQYFPFLTCEVISGDAGLDIADRQNAHSMAVAARGIVEVFKAGEKESQIDGEILTFSISHDNRCVRIYGYYPVIEGKEINIYRHETHKFSITADGGKEKWATYNFTMGVYHLHALTLIEKIRDVLDGLPPGHRLQGWPSSEEQMQEQGVEHSNRGKKLMGMARPAAPAPAPAAAAAAAPLVEVASRRKDRRRERGRDAGMEGLRGIDRHK